MREDQAADSNGAVAGPASPTARIGPPRGEKPEVSPVDGQDGQRASTSESGGRLTVAGGKAQQPGRVPHPDDLRLRVALEPAARLWRQLNRWQQRRVTKATQAELGRPAGMLMQPDTARSCWPTG
ncbi:hypothetical protein [Streptomyces sp. HPF1205]|uniref:hypothetical protein n=1 Tax=Streptomyces sp. HPF1205 TaxID=2873262 RepID=UPI001CEE0387|nr:hypothetical protein [Streptomyces sp. HPF1205]